MHGTWSRVPDPDEAQIDILQKENVALKKKLSAVEDELAALKKAAPEKKAPAKKK